jgi:hypothetical protein
MCRLWGVTLTRAGWSALVGAAASTNVPTLSEQILDLINQAAIRNRLIIIMCSASA